MAGGFAGECAGVAARVFEIASNFGYITDSGGPLHVLAGGSTERESRILRGERIIRILTQFEVERWNGKSLPF